MKVVAVLALIYPALAAGGIFDLNWDDLRTSWSLNPISSTAFTSRPRKVDGSQGFELREDNCKNAGKFVGLRYWNPKDPTVTLIYDKNGIIAGIQTSTPKGKYAPPTKLQGTIFLDDGDYWTQSAYFIDPALICAKGRTEDDLKKQGTGQGLWIQNGPNPLKKGTL